MKTKLVIILAFSLIASFALADITVTDNARVIKDGADIGAVADAVKNGVVTPSEVQVALVAKMTEVADKRADLDRARAEAETKAAFALEKLKAKKAKEEASGKGKKWEALDELEAELSASEDAIRDAEIDAKIEELKKQKKKKP